MEIKEADREKRLRVGLIDSGKGGEYISSLLQERFNVETVRWVPSFFISYSNMGMDDLVRNAEYHIEFLLSSNVDMVVIGCMTLSTNLTNFIRRQLGNIPVYDLYEFLPMFGSNTLVIGTTNTINSRKFNNYITLPCPDISKSIEGGCVGIVIGLLRGYECSLRPASNFDRVILGCSHYSICKNLFEEYYFEKKIVDPIEYLLDNLKGKLNVPNYEFAGCSS